MNGSHANYCFKRYLFLFRDTILDVRWSGRGLPAIA